MTPAAQLDDLLDRARAATPVLAAHAAETERAGRPAPESQKAIREAGAFALTTPERFGGLGVDRVTMVRVLAELGRACPSTAWVAAVTAEMNRFFTPMMSEPLLADLFTEPDVRVCGSGAPPGQAQVAPGGVRISGRWGYASGCEDAPWALVMTVLFDGDRLVRVAPVVLPTDRMRIDRTWDVAGLQGTGSHTLVADDVFVPDARIVDMPTDASGMPDFAAFPEGLVTNAVCLIGPMLGAAQGALDVVAGVLATRKPPYGPHENLAASPGVQQLFARAAHLQHGARTRVLTASDRLDRLAGTGMLSDTDIAAIALDLVTAAQECRRSVDTLLDLHGSSSFGSGNPLQRFWRDVNVGTRHAVFTPYLAWETYAGMLAAPAA